MRDRYLRCSFAVVICQFCLRLERESVGPRRKLLEGIRELAGFPVTHIDGQGLVMDQGEPVAFAQFLVRNWFGIFSIALCTRGPVWLGASAGVVPEKASQSLVESLKDPVDESNGENTNGWVGT